jgi:hypothetical protein
VGIAFRGAADNAKSFLNNFDNIFQPGSDGAIISLRSQDGLFEVIRARLAAGDVCQCPQFSNWPIWARHR